MRIARLPIFFVLVLVALVPLPAAARALTITDDAGRVVTLEKPAARIVLTDGMGLIGLAAIDPDPIGRLAGWNRGRLDADALAAFRKAVPAIDAVPDIGELRSGPAAIELLIGIGPDLVILDPYYARSDTAIRQLESAGIAVAVLALTPSIRDAEPVQGIKRLAVLLGREEQGNAFSDFVGARLERIRSRVAGLAPDDRPSVLLEAHAGRGACCMVAGAGQGIGDFIGFVGGHNVGGDIVPGMAGQISPEFVMASAPSVYIGTGGSYMAPQGGLTVGPSFPPQVALASLERAVSRTGLAEVPAVVEGRAYGLWHALSISGINIVAIEAMAKWIRPDLFADVDPAATLAEIDARFLAVPLTGTMWVRLGEGKTLP